MGWFKKKLPHRARRAPSRGQNHATRSHYQNSSTGKQDLEHVYCAQLEHYSELKPVALRFLKYQKIKIDTSRLSADDRKRTIDFLSGMMFSFQGKVHVVANNIYLFDITGQQGTKEPRSQSNDYDDEW